MIRWITKNIGTGPYEKVSSLSGDFKIVDVRELLDRSGNSLSGIKKKIEESLAFVRNGERIVLCCDYGISRSNAIAAGVISVAESVSLVAAVRTVVEKTGETQIKPEVLGRVLEAIQGKKKKAGTAILLTGATGDIGQALAEPLKREFHVLCPGRSEIDLVNDLTLLDLFVKENNIGCIVHLAHPRVANSNLALGQALSMMQNVVDVCSQNNCRIIFISSTDVFAAHKTPKLQVKDKTGFAPSGIFGTTKFLAEELIRNADRNSKLNYAIIRTTAVYGRGCLKPKFIWNFISKARKGSLITTHRSRSGFPIVDPIHVSDIVELLLSVCRRNFKGVLNVGGGAPLSTKRIAEMIRKGSGSRSGISSIRIEETKCQLVFDNKKAYKMLGWKPQAKFEDVIVELLNLHNHEN